MPRVELVLANGIEECFFVYFKLHFRAMTKDFGTIGELKRRSRLAYPQNKVQGRSVRYLKRQLIVVSWLGLPGSASCCLV